MRSPNPSLKSAVDRRSPPPPARRARAALERQQREREASAAAAASASAEAAAAEAPIRRPCSSSTGGGTLEEVFSVRVASDAAVATASAGAADGSSARSGGTGTLVLGVLLGGPMFHWLLPEVQVHRPSHCSRQGSYDRRLLLQHSLEERDDGWRHYWRVSSRRSGLR